jgi:hypothetical protein
MGVILLYRTPGGEQENGKKRSFFLAEEGPRKPEGFRESERSERVRLPRSLVRVV